jgi:hypothetical protein
MFNWALKGVSVEKRPREPKRVLEPQTVAVDLPETPAAVEPVRNAEAVLFNFANPAPAPTYGANYNAAFAGNTLGNRHILFASPKNTDEMRAIVDHLKTNNEAVVVNFTGTAPAERQRSIDFLSGVACGLGGTIFPIDNEKYILTPSGLGVH